MLREQCPAAGATWRRGSFIRCAVFSVLLNAAAGLTASASAGSSDGNVPQDNTPIVVSAVPTGTIVTQPTVISAAPTETIVAQPRPVDTIVAQPHPVDTTEAMPGTVPESMMLDCTSDFTNRVVAWSAAKKDWCCKKQGVGCPELFDCAAGLNNAEAGWSPEKKSWCCTNKGAGCAEPFDCAAGLVNAEAGWSLEKKAWCCNNKGIACREPFDCGSGLGHDEPGWSDQKSAWCCLHKGLGCADPYDCAAGGANAAGGWPLDKQQWCCQNKGVGCAASFDCAAGVANAERGWSPEKKDWCCKYKAVGCNEFDCEAGFENRDAGWSVSKKDWCCKNRMVGCKDNENLWNHFGPGYCVEVSRSAKGTCVLTTRCTKMNISNTEFAFVCFNPGTSLPHALHSYGRGGFDEMETFDTGVRCKMCSTVDAAFRTGGSLVRNALKTLPRTMLPVSAVPAYDDGKVGVEATRRVVVRDSMEVPVVRPQYPEVQQKTIVTAPAPTVRPVVVDVPTAMRRADATFFGPNNCVSTFRSPGGTCIIQTRCTAQDLADFNVGITCVDKTGSNARYMFGKGTFAEEELFDSRMECEVCLGVSEGDDPAVSITTLVPKTLILDVETLKTEIVILRQQVHILMTKINVTTITRTVTTTVTVTEELAPAPKLAAAPATRPTPKPTQKPTPKPTHPPLPPPSWMPTPKVRNSLIDKSSPTPAPALVEEAAVVAGGAGAAGGEEETPVIVHHRNPSTGETSPHTRDSKDVREVTEVKELLEVAAKS